MNFHCTYFADDEGSYSFDDDSFSFRDDSFSFRDESYDPSFSFIRKKRDVNGNNVYYVAAPGNNSSEVNHAFSNLTIGVGTAVMGPAATLGLSAGLAEVGGILLTGLGTTSSSAANFSLSAADSDTAVAANVLNGEEFAFYRSGILFARARMLLRRRRYHSSQSVIARTT